MTRPERDNLLTTQEVAELLGVSPMRVRQMLTEGKLPQPTNLGARFYVWHRADIEAMRAVFAGETATRPSAALSPPLSPLTRIADRVLSIPSHREGTVDVHLRVWHGSAPEGQRTVVVLGQMRKSLSLSANLDAVIAVVTPMIPCSVAEAVWFLYRPESDSSGSPQKVDNLTWRHDNSDLEPAFESWLRTVLAHRTQPSPASVHRPLLRAMTVPEIERIVGGPVEAYPLLAYTRKVVETWRETGRIVEFRYDALDCDPLIDAANTLAKERALITDLDRQTVLNIAVHMLVDEVRRRYIDLGPRVLRDSTQPEFQDVPTASWPTTWAARLSLPDLDPHQDLLDAWPEPFEMDRELSQHPEHRQSLSQLRSWSREVDRHADDPDLRLHTALEQAAWLLAFHIGIDNSEFRRNDHPDSFAQVHEVAGDWDQRYLKQLIPLVDPDKPEDRRAQRLLRDRLLPLIDGPAEALETGLDPAGRIVVHHPGRGRKRSPMYAVEWPLQPCRIPPSTRIVADAEPERPRPVYLAHPDGWLDLLPADPDTRNHDWGFGYLSSDTYSLEQAIISAFSRGDGKDPSTMPAAWIKDQLAYTRPNQPLDISVDELRRRYPTT